MIKSLIRHEEIGWILARKDKDTQIMIGKHGTVEFMNSEIKKIAASPFKSLKIDDRIISSLARYATFVNNGDLVLFGNVDDDGKLYAFENHKGTHGGFYGEMTKPFILTNNQKVINQLKKNDYMNNLFKVIRSSYGADKL